MTFPMDGDGPGCAFCGAVRAVIEDAIERLGFPADAICCQP